MKLKDYQKRLQNEEYDIPNVLPKIKPIANNKRYVTTKQLSQRKTFNLRWAFAFGCLIFLAIPFILIGTRGKVDSVLTEEYSLSAVQSEEKLKGIVNSANTFRQNSYSNFSLSCAAKNDYKTQPPKDIQNIESQKMISTNNQVENIDEDDIVKIDNTHIYSLYKNKINIYDYINQEITFNESIDLNVDIMYSTGTLQLTDKYVIAMYLTTNHESEVAIYNINDSFKKEYVYNIPGEIKETRLTNNKLYVVTSEILEKDNLHKPFSHVNNKKEERKYSDVIYVGNIHNSCYINITTITLEDDIEISTKTQLGTRNITTYMGENNLYIASYDVYTMLTTLYVYGLVDAKTELKGIMQEKGYLNDQYSLDEYDNNLRMFLTNNLDFKNKNYLYTYDLNSKLSEDLKYKAIGTLNEGIGEENQTIRSAYFDKEYGYVVTYEQKDPLYKINISDPTNPIIISKVKAEGYSGYLHKFNDYYMIGIGYTDIENPKLSLYKIDGNPIQIGLDYVFKEDTSIKDTVVSYNFKEQKELFVMDDNYTIGIPVYTISVNTGKYNAEVLTYKLNMDKVKAYEEFINDNQFNEGDLYLNYCRNNESYSLYKKTEGSWVEEFKLGQLSSSQLEKYKKYAVDDYDLTTNVFDLVIVANTYEIPGYNGSQSYSYNVSSRNAYAMDNELYETCFSGYEVNRMIYVNGQYIGVSAAGLCVFNENYESKNFVYSKTKK